MSDVRGKVDWTQTQLSEMVRELGGTVESALTISVTHVVAVGFGSPKYMVS